MPGQLHQLTHQLHSGPYPWMLALVDIGTAFWFAVYVLAIVAGLRHKTYAVPMVAICANFSWELLAAVVTIAPVTLWHIGDIVWMVLDAGIVYTLLRYGRAGQTIPELKRWFYAIVATTFAFMLLLQYGLELAMRDRYGFIDAYLIAVMMSVLFFFLFFDRRFTDAFSYWIAICKFLGNGLTSVGFLFLYPLLYDGQSRSLLLYVLCLACVVLDAGYVWLLWTARRRATLGASAVAHA